MAEWSRRANAQEQGEPALPAALFAELLGTFALTLVAAGSEVVAALSGDVDQTARAIAPALVIMAMIYALGDVSGAHFNPAVTLAFALRGDFPWIRVPGYWFVQLLGAVLAAALLRLLFGPVAHLGRTDPHYGMTSALIIELVLTMLLVTVILGTATRAKVVGPSAALAVGGTIAFAGLFAGPVSGASLNPARSLGPALVAGDLGFSWIYVVGPIAGGLLAVLVTWIVHGRHQPAEEHVAQGEKQASGSPDHERKESG